MKFSILNYTFEMKSVFDVFSYINNNCNVEEVDSLIFSEITPIEVVHSLIKGGYELTSDVSESEKVFDLTSYLTFHISPSDINTVSSLLPMIDFDGFHFLYILTLGMYTKPKEKYIGELKSILNKESFAEDLYSFMQDISKEVDSFVSDNKTDICIQRELETEFGNVNLVSLKTKDNDTFVLASNLNQNTLSLILSQTISFVAENDLFLEKEFCLEDMEREFSILKFKIKPLDHNLFDTIHDLVNHYQIYISDTKGKFPHDDGYDNNLIQCQSNLDILRLMNMQIESNLPS